MHTAWWNEFLYVATHSTLITVNLVAFSFNPLQFPMIIWFSTEKVTKFDRVPSLTYFVLNFWQVLHVLNFLQLPWNF